MDLPALQQGEQWRVKSPGVYVKSVPYHAFLTDRRLILKSPNDPLMPDRDLALDRIEGVEPYLNGAGEPVLAIQARTGRGESRKLVLTFAGKPGNRSRVGEMEEWIRNIPVVPSPPGTGPASSPRKSSPRAGYDPAKLVFSPGLHDPEYGGATFPKERANPAARENYRGDSAPRFPVRDREVPAAAAGALSPPGSLPEDLPFFCTTCGNRGRPGSRFCDRCGAAVIPPDPAAILMPLRNRDFPVREEPVFSPPPVRLFRPSPPPPCYREESGPLRDPGTAAGIARGRKNPAHRPWSRRATAIATLCLVAAVVAGLAFLLMPEESSGILFGAASLAGGNFSFFPAAGNASVTPAADRAGITSIGNAVASLPSTGVYVKVTYTGSWSGSYGMQDAMQAVSDKGDKIFPVEDAADLVTAIIRKGDSTKGKLTVELYRDGKMIATGHTTDPGGEVVVSGPV